jgi:hypothetical protein
MVVDRPLRLGQVSLCFVRGASLGRTRGHRTEGSGSSQRTPLASLAKTMLSAGRLDCNPSASEGSSALPRPLCPVLVTGTREPLESALASGLLAALGRVPSDRQPRGLAKTLHNLAQPGQGHRTAALVRANIRRGNELAPLASAWNPYHPANGKRNLQFLICNCLIFNGTECVQRSGPRPCIAN